MVLDFSSDLAIPEADSAVNIIYKSADADPVYDPSAGTSIPSYTNVHLSCLKGAVSNKDIEAGNSKLVHGDVKWYIRDSEVSGVLTGGVPKETDEIEDSSENRYRLLLWRQSPDDALWTVFVRRITKRMA